MIQICPIWNCSKLGAILQFGALVGRCPVGGGPLGNS